MNPPWGVLLGAYFVLIGLPSGLGLIGWWLAETAPAGARLEQHARLLSLAALAVVGLLLVVDLGRPERFYLMLTRFDNLASPISVGAKLIAVKGGLLAFAVVGGWRAHHLDATDSLVLPARAARLTHAAVRVGLLVTSFALAAYPAAVLARTWTSPLAGSSGGALLFVLTALIMGTGAALVAVIAAPATAGLAELTVPLRRALAVLLGGYAIALAMQALAAIGDTRLHAPMAALAHGSYALAWWVGGVGVGLAVPTIALAAFPARRAALAVAAITAIAGACIVRYLLFAVTG